MRFFGRVRRVLEGDRGASFPEYLVAGALALVILAGLVAAGLPGAVGDAAGRVVCRVTSAGGPGRCAARGGHPRAAATGRPRTGREGGAPFLVPVDRLPYAPVPSRHGPSGDWMPDKDGPLFEFRDRRSDNWDCGAVFDVACKIGGGVYQGGREIVQGAATLGCLAHLCSQSGFTSTWSGFAQIFQQNPGTTLKQMWQGFSTPFVRNWHEGGPGKAFAYALPGALAAVLRPAALAKAGEAVRHRPHLPRHVPRPPAKLARADADAARRAAEHGDVRGARRSLASLRKRVAAARAGDRAHGCPLAAPPAGPPSRTHVTHAALTAAARVRAAPAAARDCGEEERIARELGVTGDKALHDLLDRIGRRNDFSATRAGRYVTNRIGALETLVAKSAKLMRRGDPATIRVWADKEGATYVRDLRRRAEKEKDPEKKAILDDAVNTGERLIMTLKDNERTAWIHWAVRVNYTDLSPKDIERLSPDVDYDADGPALVDHAHPDADGKPVLRIDRREHPVPGELTAMSVLTIKLDKGGFFSRSPNGLRDVLPPDAAREGWSAAGRERYAARCRALYAGALKDAAVIVSQRHVGSWEISDPVLREIDGRLPSISGIKSWPARIDHALKNPMSAFGGRSMDDYFADEYDKALGHR